MRKLPIKRSAGLFAFFFLCTTSSRLRYDISDGPEVCLCMVWISQLNSTVSVSEFLKWNLDSTFPRNCS